MIAIAANSPLLGGKFSSWLSTRQRVWSALDSARCGPIWTTGGEDLGTGWARYALKAPVMLVHNPPGGTAMPVTQYAPFADWADGRTLLGGRRPTTADLDYHLTTLFPPVRPRGWLEIRYLDSVPDDVWPALVFTLVALLYDPVASDSAGEAVEPVATAWDTAARVGLAGWRLCTRRPTGVWPSPPNGRQVRSTTRWADCSRRSSRADVPLTTSPTGSSTTASRR